MVRVLRLQLGARGLLLAALPPRNRTQPPVLLSAAAALPSSSGLAPALALSLALSPRPAIRCLCCCSSGGGGHEMEAEQGYKFGPYKIDRSEVFYSTALSYAMVNLRPVVPDVLVCPRREVKRYVDLTADETIDLWFAAKEVGGRLENYHKASSLTFTIQDGPQAGQTVPHLHIHILPRKIGDFQNNDEIYDAIDAKESQLKDKLDLDKERKDRTPEEMSHEAEEYRALFS